ncbi:hypothetical protein TNCV_431921 [Trichonephila clavipes]|nr:hypothetical protein TNCV_431921 [Trichonephila clavipes]
MSAANDDTKGVRLSKEMTPLSITPDYVPVWSAVVKAGSARCPGCLQTRLRLSSGHSRKWDSSLNTICP